MDRRSNSFLIFDGQGRAPSRSGVVQMGRVGTCSNRFSIPVIQCSGRTELSGESCCPGLERSRRFLEVAGGDLTSEWVSPSQKEW
jgi:hypothetical protein